MSFRTPYLDYIYKRRKLSKGLEYSPMSSSNYSSESLSERSPPRRPHKQAEEGSGSTSGLHPQRRSIHLGLPTIRKPTNSECARTKEYHDEAPRKDPDPFTWLLSTHRQFPELTQSAAEYLLGRHKGTEDLETEFRNLRRTAKARLGVYRSKIHGRGLFSLLDIEAGEMVIEYTGEMVRLQVLEEREKDYKKKGIQCSSFQIDDIFALDGTKKGNAARFINHSCKPNCYFQRFTIDGKNHLIIMSLIDIGPLDEITCDYNFNPEKDDKIICFCEGKTCPKFLN